MPEGPDRMTGPMPADGAIARPTLARVPGLHPRLNLGAFVEATRSVPAETVAIIDISGREERTVTYGDLEEDVRRAVGALRGLGIGRDARVAMALPNSSFFLVLFLALMRRGAVPVFLNPRLAAETLRFILQDSGARALVADLEDVPALQALATVPGLELLVAAGSVAATPWLQWSKVVKGAAPDASVEAMDFDAQAFQPYTAGSTGVPKGIVLTHGGMLWGIEHGEAYFPRRPEERGIVAAPMFHKNAMRGTIKPMLRAGASVVIMKSFGPNAYLEALARYRVTVCGGVPAMFSDILRETGALASGDYGALETISMGSSTVPAELTARLAAAFPGVAIKESYGLTEGGGPTRSHPDGRPTPSGSVGVIAPEYEGRLVGEDDNARAVGELQIRSPYILKEYAGRPELTAERLHDGWLRTGDIFRMDEDGFLYFLGRTDDMFSCGGENIYPKDVENLILSHPAVGDAIVVPLPHETKGAAPAAMVKPRRGENVSPRQIQDHCAANGPAFAIPRAVIVREDLPRTDAGKPDRKAARAELAAAFGTLQSSSRQRETAR